MKCPFCGIESDVAHETQEGCIQALNAEISRVRELLQHVRSVDVPLVVDIDAREADEAARGPTKV